MKKIRFAFVIALFMHFSAQAGTLKPFTTDGCSAFPDGTIDQQSLWVNCCIKHDLAYWKGGTQAERLEADQQLESCVKKVGEPEIAKLMLTGVRVGGAPHFNTPFRWGYGWPYRRGYLALTQEEKIEVKRKLEIFKVMIDSISEQLSKSIK